MTAHQVAPGRPSKLDRAIGSGGLVATIGGVVVAHDKTSPINIRRARPASGDSGLGEPATCSFDVITAELPTWEKGDPVTVELTDAALRDLFPGEDGTRTNYAYSPCVGGTGWTHDTARFNVVVQANTDGPAVASGGRYSRVKVTTPGPAEGSFIQYGHPTQTPYRWAVDGGGYNTISWYVRSQVARNAQLEVTWVDATGIILGTYQEGLIALPAAAWARLSTTGVAPVEAVAGILRLIFRGGPDWVLDQTVDATAVLAEWSDTLGAFFDGDTPDTASAAQEWLGTDLETELHQGYSRQVSSATVAARDEARYRFRGQVSDLDIQPARRGLARVTVVGASTLGRLGSVMIGDEPWPVETVPARAARIITRAKAAQPDLDLVTPDWFTYAALVRAQDVDRRPVAELLTELVETRGPGAALIERRSGQVVFTTDLAADLPSLWLPSACLTGPNRSTRTPRVNDVTVWYGPKDGPAEGLELRRNYLANPSWQSAGSWTASGATFSSVGTVSGVAPADRTLCARMVTTAASAAYYQDVPAAFGQDWTLSAAFRYPAGLAGKKFVLALQALNASNVEQGRVEFQLPDGPVTDWARYSVTYPALPGGTTKVRALVIWAEAVVTAGITAYIDAALLERGQVAGAYFDGATTDTDAYNYNWTSTAELSASTITSTGRAPRYARRVTDEASIAAHGRWATEVDTALDVSNTTADLDARGQAELSEGGWTLPELTVDVVRLLSGEWPYLTDPTDGLPKPPAVLARRVLLAELGSQRRVSYPDAFAAPAELPPVHNQLGHITSWVETITRSAWTITTTSERTPE